LSCQERFPDEMLERYVRGELSERDRRALEDHYFECPACLERVETLQAVAGVLAPAGRPRTARRAPTWRTAALLGGLAAASVLLIVLQQKPDGGHATGPRPPASGPAARPPQPTGPTAPVVPVVDYSDLAAISAPRYEPSSLRGAGRDSGFAAAMGRYTAGDFAAAAAALDAVLRRAPGDPQILFYAGVSALLAGRPDDGVTRLEKVVIAGDTPYLEEARFYLAKAHLQRGDAATAERELQRVIALRGDLEAVARELLDRVSARRSGGRMPAPASAPP
jgi:tetratricopeptide (TPR) repeat protein